MHEETHFAGGQALNHLVAGGYLPAVIRLGICAEYRFKSQPLRVLQLNRAIGLTPVKHHFILHHHAFIPHGRGQAFGVSCGAIGPVGKAAPQIALVEPGNNLRFFQQPARE